MQKVTNVLLASNKAESPPTSEIKQARTRDSKPVDNNDFSTALEQAGIEEKQQVKSKHEAANSRHEPVNGEVTDEESAAEDELNSEGLIDVSHVLAQLNLAAELSDTVIFSGDNLPLDEISIDVIAAAFNIESLDEQLINELQNKSGLTKEELHALPPETLSLLVTLVKSGDNHYQEIQNAIDASKKIEVLADDDVLSLQGLSEQNKGLGTRVVADKLSDKELLETSIIKGLSVDKIKQVEVPKEILERKVSIAGGQDSIPNRNESKFSNILGEKAASQTEIIISSNSKSLTEGQIAAEQQLKGADLSVKLTPMKAGMELSSAFIETTQGSESKLQQINSQLAPQQTQRNDLSQIQLSLKESNEQQVQMEDMIKRFSPVMKQQLVTMVSQGRQYAEIKLDPPELGHLIVRIQVQGEQTQVQFQVAQHQTRDLIEQAMPRLKDLLSEQGMQLSDSQVSQDNGNSGEEGENGSEEGQLSSERDEITPEESLISSKQATSYPSGIDYYA